MFSRRFRRSRRGFRRSAGRLMVQLSTVERNKRWTVANFHFIQPITAAAGVTTLTALRVADVAGGIGQVGTAQGLQLSQGMRRLEIAALRFSWCTFLNQAPAAGVSEHLPYIMALATLRLTNGGGLTPVNIPDFTINQSPIAITPAAATVETNFPERLHYRDMGLLTTGANDNVPPNYYPMFPRKVRLMHSIDDSQQLDFVHNIVGSGAGARNVTWVVNGQLWFRWRM